MEQEIVKVVEGQPPMKDPLDIWVLEDTARNGHGEIVCLRENTSGDGSLAHYVIDKAEMFDGKCDEYILGYRYQVEKDKDGNITQTSVYPYKDWNILNTIQTFYEMNERNKRVMSATSESLVNLDYRQTMSELNLIP